MCRTNKHIEFIRETPGMESEEQQSFCFHLESCSSTLAATIRVSKQSKNEKHTQCCVRYIIVHETTHSKKATPLLSLVRRTATYWCKFINFIATNSHYVFKINSTHYVVLHHRLPFFCCSMFGLSLRFYWCAQKKDLTAELIVFRGFRLGEIHVFFSMYFSIGRT